jgi:hypothetical protein
VKTHSQFEVINNNNNNNNALSSSQCFIIQYIIYILYYLRVFWVISSMFFSFILLKMYTGATYIVSVKKYDHLHVCGQCQYLFGMKLLCCCKHPDSEHTLHFQIFPVITLLGMAVMAVIMTFPLKQVVFILNLLEF